MKDFSVGDMYWNKSRQAICKIHTVNEKSISYTWYWLNGSKKECANVTIETAKKFRTRYWHTATELTKALF